MIEGKSLMRLSEYHHQQKKQILIYSKVGQRMDGCYLSWSPEYFYSNYFPKFDYRNLIPYALHLWRAWLDAGFGGRGSGVLFLAQTW